MHAERSGGSHPEEAEGTGAGAPPEPRPDTSRAEMETSVLDALGPLFRGKRRRPERGREEAGSAGPGDDGAPAPEMGGPADDALSAAAEPDTDGLPLGLGRDPVPVEDEIETFAAIGEDLERRSRQSATLVRLLEQHRQQLVTAERERDAAYAQLARIVPVVQETARNLREAMDARRLEEDPAPMHKLFVLNGRALDELEKVATTLFADYLWVKSAWEPDRGQKPRFTAASARPNWSAKSSRSPGDSSRATSTRSPREWSARRCRPNSSSSCRCSRVQSGFRRHSRASPRCVTRRIMSSSGVSSTSSKARARR